MAPPPPDPFSSSSPSPLFSNTTYTTYRVSPLHHTPPPSTSYPHILSSSLLTPSVLAYHASRFRDILTGSTLRGVRVGGVGAADDDDPEEGHDGGGAAGEVMTTAEKGALSKVGGLVDVTWRVLGEDGREEDGREEDDGEEGRGEERRRREERRAKGISIRIVYERAGYDAFLLRSSARSSLRRRHRETSLSSDEDSDSDSDEEAPTSRTSTTTTHLPLLLLHLPSPLRLTLLDYLSTTFDCYFAPLRLPSAFLVHTLETYLSDLHFSPSPSPDRTTTMTSTLHLTLTFPNADVDRLLRTLDLSVAPQDVSRFLSEGEKILSRRPNTNSERRYPFTTALSEFTTAHLAMPLTLLPPTPSHSKDRSSDDAHPPHVALSKIACEAFSLSREGRVKLRAGGRELGMTEGEGDDDDDDELRGVLERVIRFARKGEEGV
ncbi:MAG: hypothetical protein M1817_004689 [Caeruleum heppii]|nr:MAG: hypothetical protein M1817_004689 [Caeruleum heppii]